MLNAPSHRVDARAILVIEDDTAWDKSRIFDEIEKLGKLGHRHPFAVYQSGETRYDLGAAIRLPDGTTASATDYLDLAQAWCFNLRRLNWDEVYSVEQAIRVNPNLGHALACRMGLQSITGPGAPEIEHDALKMVTGETMQALFDLRASLPSTIGSAVFAASLPLSEAEKKA